MDNNKIDSWISAIVNEDGHNLSSGSLRTLKMIRYEIQKSCQPIEESEQEEIRLIKVKFKDHTKIILTNKHGDTYTSSSEELMDFFH